MSLKETQTGKFFMPGVGSKLILPEDALQREFRKAKEEKIAKELSDKLTEASKAKQEELAGKFCKVGADGVALASDGGADAVGLFREDLGDMVNASLKASFYFRGGEYYVHESRVADGAVDDLAVGDKITSDAEGKIRKADPAKDTCLGVVTHIGRYTAGNMYEWAEAGFDAEKYIGFIMYI